MEAMTLDQIVNEVHAYVDPIRTQCERFSTKVEEYATKLEKSTAEASKRHWAELERRKKERERLGVKTLPDESLIPGADGTWFFEPSPSDREYEAGPPHDGWIWTQFCDYNYIDWAEMDVFWRPAEPAHPVEWLSLPWDHTTISVKRPSRELTVDERLMCECFRLASIHDLRLHQTYSHHQRVFLDRPYAGRFLRNKAARALADEMHGSPRGVEDLQLVWEWVKAELDKRAPGQMNGPEQASAAAVTRGDLPARRSKPMSKTKMMRALGIDSYKTFSAWVADKGLQPAGNRQTWTVSLDGLDSGTQRKLEKA